MHTVGSAEEARRAVGCGVDIVVAQGWEAGGHVWGGVATLPLVPAVVDAVAPVPVIAAGGIGDARGVAAVLALGAQAALLGTRFLLADEMPIHEEYRRRLIAARETDAEWYPDLYEVGWPDSPHRAIHNSTAEMWEAAGRPPLGSRPGEGLIAQFASGESILRYSPAPPMAGTTGEIEALSLWAGQSVALARQLAARRGDRGRTRLPPVAPARVKGSPASTCIDARTSSWPSSPLRQPAFDGPAPTVLDVAAISPFSAFSAATKISEKVGNGWIVSVSTSSGTWARIASVACCSHSPASGPSA